MLIGIDTSFLVHFEIVESSAHQPARAWASARIEKQDQFGIAPQVLFEFMHVVTDSKRFMRPLTISQALERAMIWWSAKETKQLTFPAQGLEVFQELMQTHSLGRKRILDTALAATFINSKIKHVVSYNWRDFSALGSFTVYHPGE